MPGTIPIRVVSIDAWADGEGGWEWNDSWTIGETEVHEEVFNSEETVLQWLIQHEYLLPTALGKVNVLNEWPYYEVQLVEDGEPIMAVIVD